MIHPALVPNSAAPLPVEPAHGWVDFVAALPRYFCVCFGVCFYLSLAEYKRLTRSPIQQPTVCFFGIFVFVAVYRTTGKQVAKNRMYGRNCC
jgi:hypothetical protein